MVGPAWEGEAVLNAAEEVLSHSALEMSVGIWMEGKARAHKLFRRRYF